MYEALARQIWSQQALGEICDTGCLTILKGHFGDISIIATQEGTIQASSLNSDKITEYKLTEGILQVEYICNSTFIAITCKNLYYFKVIENKSTLKIIEVLVLSLPIVPLFGCWSEDDEVIAIQLIDGKFAIIKEQRIINISTPRGSVWSNLNDKKQKSFKNKSHSNLKGACELNCAEIIYGSFSLTKPVKNSSKIYFGGRYSSLLAISVNDASNMDNPPLFLDIDLYEPIRSLCIGTDVIIALTNQGLIAVDEVTGTVVAYYRLRLPAIDMFLVSVKQEDPRILPENVIINTIEGKLTILRLWKRVHKSVDNKKPRYKKNDVDTISIKSDIEKLNNEDILTKSSSNNKNENSNLEECKISASHDNKSEFEDKNIESNKINKILQTKIIEKSNLSDSLETELGSGIDTLLRCSSKDKGIFQVLFEANISEGVQILTANINQNKSAILVLGEFGDLFGYMVTAEKQDLVYDWSYCPQSLESVESSIDAITNWTNQKIVLTSNNPYSKGMLFIFLSFNIYVESQFLVTSKNCLPIVTPYMSFATVYYKNQLHVIIFATQDIYNINIIVHYQTFQNEYLSDSMESKTIRRLSIPCVNENLTVQVKYNHDNVEYFGISEVDIIKSDTFTPFSDKVSARIDFNNSLAKYPALVSILDGNSYVIYKDCKLSLSYEPKQSSAESIVANMENIDKVWLEEFFNSTLSKNEVVLSVPKLELVKSRLDNEEEDVLVLDKSIYKDKSKTNSEESVIFSKLEDSTEKNYSLVITGDSNISILNILNKILFLAENPLKYLSIEMKDMDIDCSGISLSVYLTLQYQECRNSLFKLVNNMRDKIVAYKELTNNVKYGTQLNIIDKAADEIKSECQGILTKRKEALEAIKKIIEVNKKVQNQLRAKILSLIYSRKLSSTHYFELLSAIPSANNILCKDHGLPWISVGLNYETNTIGEYDVLTSHSSNCSESFTNNKLSGEQLVSNNKLTLNRTGELDFSQGNKNLLQSWEIDIKIIRPYYRILELNLSGLLKWKDICTPEFRSKNKKQYAHEVENHILQLLYKLIGFYSHC